MLLSFQFFLLAAMEVCFIEGWAYFSSMTEDYGIQPRGQHYAAIVDLLGRAGRLQEAYELGKACKEHSVI